MTENSMYNPSEFGVNKVEGTQLIAILIKIKINSFGEHPNVLERNCGSRPKTPSEKMERWQSLVERAQTLELRNRYTHQLNYSEA